MPLVSSCPKCEAPVLVPDGVDPSAKAKCPECQEQFELQEALADPDYPDEAKLILDVSKSQSLSERSTSDIRNMANYLSSRSGNFSGICAIVAGESLHFGLMRMASVFAESKGMRTSVFKSKKEALDWLQSIE